MELLDNARETIKATSEKAKHDIHEAVDRLGDKAEEAKADAEVRKAEIEREAVVEKNEYKEELRDTT